MKTWKSHNRVPVTYTNAELYKNQQGFVLIQGIIEMNFQSQELLVASAPKCHHTEAQAVNLWSYFI